jgi:hypothetical protein
MFPDDDRIWFGILAEMSHVSESHFPISIREDQRRFREELRCSVAELRDATIPRPPDKHASDYEGGQQKNYGGDGDCYPTGFHDASSRPTDPSSPALGRRDTVALSDPASCGSTSGAAQS